MIMHTLRCHLPIALVCLILATASCASSKDAQGETPKDATQQRVAEADTAAPMPNAKPYVDAAADWFPADTYAIGAMTSEQYWSLATRFFPEKARDTETDAPGTLGGLQSDLSAMMLDRVGVDFTGLEGAVFGIGHDSGGLVLFGEFELDDARFAPQKVDGHEVLAFQMNGMKTDEDGDGVWMVRFDEPRKGVAVFYKKTFLERALATRYGSDDSDANLTSDRANLDLPLFDDLPAGSFVAVARADERLLEEIGKTPFPPPDRVGMSFGDNLTVLMEGSEQSLDGVSQYAARFRSMATSQVERLQREADSNDTAEAVGALIAYHYAYAYLESFQEDRGGGRLTYSMAVPDTGATFMGPGVLAAIAIPAFLKYIKRSKATEAASITRKMADGARVYFHTDQTTCATGKICRSPWHTGAQPGMPVAFKDYVFPGGTNVHVKSMDSPPRSGSKSMPEPTLGPKHRASARDIEPILDALGLVFSDPMYFQYVYKTGTGTGVDATATILAVADFDGSGEPNHTVRIELSVDPRTQEVRVTPSVTMNEFE
jgi:hypothetical protein